MSKRASLQSISKSMTEHTRILNELVFYLTADYRAANPEANAAFFEEYPEMKEFEQTTLYKTIIERVNK